MKVPEVAPDLINMPTKMPANAVSLLAGAKPAHIPFNVMVKVQRSYLQPLPGRGLPSPNLQLRGPDCLYVPQARLARERSPA